MAQFDEESFFWSEDFTLRQFVDRYKHHLPQLMRTVSGYSDSKYINDICAAEVLWVYGIQQQKRVIARTETERYVSIPTNYRLEFQQLSGRAATHGSPVDLGKLIADGRYAGMRIEPAPSASHVTMDFISATSCSSSNSEQLGRLELIDEYDEKYLRARPLVNDEIQCIPVGIPVYLPITVQVAVGLTAGSNDDFDSWFDAMTLESNSFTQQTIPSLCDDILLFETQPSGEYEYVNPSNYALARPVTSQLTRVAASRQKAAAAEPSDDILSKLASNTKRKTSLDSPPPLPPTMLHRYKRAVSCGGEAIMSQACQFASSSTTRRPLPPPKPQKPPTQIVTPLRCLKSAPSIETSTDDKDSLASTSPTSLVATSSSSTSNKDQRIWKTASEIPLNAEDFSVEQLCRSLELLNMPRLAEVFREQSVDGQLMLSIVSDDSILVNEFNCSRFDAKKLMQFALHNWRPK